MKATFLAALAALGLCACSSLSRAPAANAFQAAEFVHAPAIPARPDIARYAGKWANDDGELQIEVRLDAKGNATLRHARDKNWIYLFSDATWVGDALHYRGFAYSDRPELFEHPFHKTRSQFILTPVADDNRIRYAFFIDGQRFDYLLTRLR